MRPGERQITKYRYNEDSKGSAIIRTFARWKHELCLLQVFEIMIVTILLANVNVLRYVCYMLSAVRLSSVCDVGAPYSGG